MTRKLAIVPALALGLFASAAAAQDKPYKPEPLPSSPPTATKPAPAPEAIPMTPAKTPARGSDLIGKSIVDQADKGVGEIADLLVCESGEITAVVKREGGGLVCVPMANLQPRLEKKDVDAGEAAPTTEVDKFVFIGDRNKLLAAETIVAVDSVDDATIQRCREHFAAKVKSSEPGKTTPADKSLATGAAAKPACIKKMIGEEIKDSTGKDIGSVKDVAVDVSQAKVAYVVISTGGVAGIGNKMQGVALSGLKRSDDGKSLVLAVSSDSLKTIEGIDLDRLPMSPNLSGGARPPAGTN